VPLKHETDDPGG
jgi:hypothetical protein